MKAQTEKSNLTYAWAGMNKKACTCEYTCAGIARALLGTKILGTLCRKCFTDLYKLNSVKLNYGGLVLRSNQFLISLPQMTPALKVIKRDSKNNHLALLISICDTLCVTNCVAQGFGQA